MKYQRKLKKHIRVINNRYSDYDRYVMVYRSRFSGYNENNKDQIKNENFVESN